MTSSLALGPDTFRDSMHDAAACAVSHPQTTRDLVAEAVLARALLTAGTGRRIRTWRATVAGTAALLAGACSSPETSAQGLAEFAIRQRAADPQNVQFQNVSTFQHGDSTVVCGEFSAPAPGTPPVFERFAVMRSEVVTQADTKGARQEIAERLFAKCVDAI